MFLHIGDSRIIFLQDIIGIFNLGLKGREDNKNFFEHAGIDNIESDQNISDYANHKSFVVTSDNVYFSPISSFTLAKREEK